MKTTGLIHQCALCGGRFPGVGVAIGSKLYCCDKCANFDHQKLKMLVKMAPKLLLVLGSGLLAGYWIGRDKGEPHVK